jgi:hypothetical protein
LLPEYVITFNAIIPGSLLMLRFVDATLPFPVMRFNAELLVMSAMFSEPNDPRSLVCFTALDIHNQPSSAPDGEVIVKVPLLIAASVGAEYDERGTVATLRDVQNKTETGNTC